MTRPLFDPDRLNPPEKPRPARRERARYGAFDLDKTLTVTQASELLKRLLADRAPAPIRIVGEISNFADRKHWYFSLKDEQSVLGCVMWSSAAQKCAFTPEHGQQVVARGRFDYYGPQGRLQLYVDRLEPVGQGALELEFRKRCEALRAEGYFEESRKRPLPAFPRRIAVVTSAGGAALQDVIRTAQQRWGGVRLSVIDVRVQGAEAAPQIAHTLKALSRHGSSLGIDAVVLTRGGGSLEDLWAFNELPVARAIFNSQTPVVAAIGHETDTTIAELVADLRCSTPTQAAARLVPDARAETQRLDQLNRRLAVALRRSAQHARSRLESHARHPLFRRPQDWVARHRQQLQELDRTLAGALRDRLAAARRDLAEARSAVNRLEPRARLGGLGERLVAAAGRLRRALAQRVEQSRAAVEAREAHLRAIGPREVLDRGYSYTTDEKGRVLREAEQVRAGQILVTHLRRGRVRSAALSGDTGQSTRRRKTKTDEAPGLFESD